MLLEKIANELRNYLPNGKAVVDSYATKVASNYLHGGKNMTDQIRKLASTENLSDEYVKRVCEASNHKVSSHLYETSDDKNFQFDLAKWEDIISAPQEKTASVYDEKPVHYKTASVKLASEEVVENNNPYYTKTDPMENLLDMKDLLSRAEEDIRLKVAYVSNEMTHVYKQLYDEFGDEVRFNGYFKVAQAIVPYVDAGLIEALTYEGLNNNLIKEEDLFTIEKIASEPINEECEFFKLADYYCRLENEYFQYKLAHKEINEQLELVRNTLKGG
jgi:hypothetical protein